MLDLDSLEFVEDLIEFEGPLLSVLKDTHQKYLYYWVDVQDTFNVWLISVITPDSLQALKDRKLPIRAALLEPKTCYLAWQGSKDFKAFFDRLDQHATNSETIMTYLNGLGEHILLEDDDDDS